MTKLKISLVTVVTLVLAGCGNGMTTNQPEAQVPNTPAVEKSAGGNEGMVSSIKDAMKLGKTMKCTYKIAGVNGEEETEVVSYVEGKKIKMEMVIAGQTRHVIFNEEAMYSWSDAQKQGMKMTTACSEELAKNVPTGNEDFAPAETPDAFDEKAFKDAMDVQCVSASGVDFSIPADVTFLDQCEMMNALRKNGPGNVMPGLPGEAPSGVAPGGE